MLVAQREDGARLAAAESDPDVAPFCPACGHELFLRRPLLRAPHFAHKPGHACKVRISRHGLGRPGVSGEGQMALFATPAPLVAAPPRSHTAHPPSDRPGVRTGARVRARMITFVRGTWQRWRRRPLEPTAPPTLFDVADI